MNSISKNVAVTALEDCIYTLVKDEKGYFLAKLNYDGSLNQRTTETFSKCKEKIVFIQENNQVVIQSSRKLLFFDDKLNIVKTISLPFTLRDFYSANNDTGNLIASGFQKDVFKIFEIDISNGNLQEFYNDRLFCNIKVGPDGYIIGYGDSVPLTFKNLLIWNPKKEMIFNAVQYTKLDEFDVTEVYPIFGEVYLEKKERNNFIKKVSMKYSNCKMNESDLNIFGLADIFPLSDGTYYYLLRKKTFANIQLTRNFRQLIPFTLIFILQWKLKIPENILLKSKKMEYFEYLI